MTKRDGRFFEMYCPLRVPGLLNASENRGGTKCFVQIAGPIVRQMISIVVNAEWISQCPQQV
jgi:hypothetical protein